MLNVQVYRPLHKRGESKLKHPEKAPDNQSENWYHMSYSRWEIARPHSLILVVSSLSQNAGSNPLLNW